MKSGAAAHRFFCIEVYAALCLIMANVYGLKAQLFLDWLLCFSILYEIQYGGIHVFLHRGVCSAWHDHGNLCVVSRLNFAWIGALEPNLGHQFSLYRDTARLGLYSDPGGFPNEPSGPNWEPGVRIMLLNVRHGGSMGGQ